MCHQKGWSKSLKRRWREKIREERPERIKWKMSEGKEGCRTRQQLEARRMTAGERR